MTERMNGELIKFFKYSREYFKLHRMGLEPSDAEDILKLIVGAQEKSKNEKKPLDVFTILQLPAHLRKTAYAIHKTGRASATMISRETGKDEAKERTNLLELAKMGHLEIIKVENTDFFVSSS